MQEAQGNVEDEGGWEIDADNAEDHTSTKEVKDDSYSLPSSTNPSPSELQTEQGIW